MSITDEGRGRGAPISYRGRGGQGNKPRNPPRSVGVTGATWECTGLLPRETSGKHRKSVQGSFCAGGRDSQRWHSLPWGHPQKARECLACSEGLLKARPPHHLPSDSLRTPVPSLGPFLPGPHQGLPQVPRLQREVWGEGETLHCCSPWGPCSPFEDPSALLGSCPGPRACGSSPARVGWGGDVLRGCRRDRARTFRAPQTTPHHRGHQGGRVVRTPSSVGSTLITFWAEVLLHLLYQWENQG